MLKKIGTLGESLSKDELREVNGGMLTVQTCNTPYFNSGGPCDQGYYPHPIYGHCICCAY